MDAVIIGNPASGRGKSPDSLERYAEMLGGPEVEVWPTERPEHATELATLAGARLVVAAGGDGTVNEVINGLETDATLGILPLGTANVLARELGIPQDIEEACRRIREGEVRRIDLGVAEDGAGGRRKFACMAGVGFDARVVQAVPPGLKQRLGTLAFQVTAVKVLFEQDHPTVRVEAGGEGYDTRFAIVANGHFYGGDFRVTEPGMLTSGELRVVMVDRISRLIRPDVFANIMTRKPLDRTERSINAAEVRAHAPHGEEVPVQVDGEVWGRLPMTFRVESGALRVIY